MDIAIQEHMGLIYSVLTRSFSTNYAKIDELIQAGRIGLWRALVNFDESKGKFTTYACKAIWSSMLRELKQDKVGPVMQSINEPIDCNGTEWGDLLPAHIAAEVPDVEPYITGAMLTPYERSVIDACLAGRTFAEISAISGRHEVALQQAYRNSVLKIRNAMQ